MSPNKALWIYIIVLVICGLIGFLKGKSKVSLIMSCAFAALLILTAVHGLFAPGFANGLANVIMAVLILVFALRLAKTKKFMPSGLMLVVTLLAIILRNI